jgi:hypothetical protein
MVEELSYIIMFSRILEGFGFFFFFFVGSQINLDVFFHLCTLYVYTICVRCTH